MLKSELSDLEQELLALHYYIHEALEHARLWHDVRPEKVKLIFKMTKTFLKHCKNSKYEKTKDSYGDKFTHVLESNLGDDLKQKTKYPDRPQVYLTWVSFGTHHIIREFLPNWIWLKDETKEELAKFRKKALVRLQQ